MLLNLFSEYKSICYIFIIIAFQTTAGYGQIFNPVVKNYSPKEFGRSHEAINLAIAQDSLGMLYFGNAYGILQYDSQTWRFIHVKDGSWVTSLAVAKNGRIYVGSQNEFGYLGSNTKGQFQYISLSDSIEVENRDFNNVNQIFVLDDNLVFLSEEKIFIKTPDSLCVFTPATTFHKMFLVNDELYIRQRNLGLFKFVYQDKITKGQLVELPNGDFFKSIGISEILPVSNSESHIIFSSESGLFNTKAGMGGDFIKIENPNLDRFKGTIISGAIKISKHEYAVSTSSKGIFIIDANGNIKGSLSKKNKLAGNKIFQLYQGKDNNIWATTNKGISYIYYNSPLHYYKENAGVAGNVFSIEHYKNDLILGTSDGLLLKKNHKNSFSRFCDFTYGVWTVESVGSDMIIASMRGLFVYNGDEIYKLNNAIVFSLFYSEKNNALFAGAKDGLYIFKKETKWKLLKKVDEINEDIKSIAQNKSANCNCTELWLGTNINGAIQVRIDQKLDVDIEKYDMFDGLNEDWVLPFEYKDTVVFGTRTGLMKFLNETGMKELIPEDHRDDDKFIRGIFEESNFYGLSYQKPVYQIYQSANYVWTSIDNKISLINIGKKADIIQSPFLEVDMGKVLCFHSGNENYSWIGCDEGLVCYNHSSNFDFEKPFRTLIRKIVSKPDSLVFGGDAREKISASVYKFENRNLEFWYSAPGVPYENKTSYSYMLKGYDKDWSAWSNISHKEYTNLWEGKYTFMVKSKNIYGAISEISRYKFSILPPWYRTILAYLLYVLLSAGLVFVIVKLYIYRLQKQKQMLEKLVDERTAEIARKNKLLEFQKNEIEHQNKNITDSIIYASKIQQALLPPSDYMTTVVPPHFVLYKPRDIVSGDFYWVGNKFNKTIVIAADCTGHGVPGAFMSVLGVSLLNEIINKIEDEFSSSEILNQLRSFIIKSLRQKGKDNETKDGMDMSLGIIDLEKLEIEFSGAYNPLYIFRKNELIQIKADRMPIGIHVLQNKSFSSQTVKLTKGDMLYVFSDGYSDQFGGKKGKKFMSKRFKELLANICNEEPEVQKQILEEQLFNWMHPLDAPKKFYEQIDDILVIGIRI